MENDTLRQVPNSPVELTVSRKRRRRDKTWTVTNASQADEEIENFQAEMLGIPDWQPSQSELNTQVI